MIDRLKTVAARSQSVLTLVIVIVLVVFTGVNSFGQQATGPTVENDEVQAITVPSADIKLSFIVPGRVGEVLVKEGDFIPKGHLIARLEDEQERIQARLLKSQAGDRTKMMSAQAELAQKNQDLRNVNLAKAKGGANDWEVEHLRTNVRVAELALKAATLEHEQNQDKYAQAVTLLERMRLMSPIEGRVEKINIKPGEAINGLDPVVRIVKIDPLWIDAHVALAQARKLAMGEEVQVLFPGLETQESSSIGKIIYIASVADPASDTLPIRVEVANSQGYQAGERVTVRFPSRGGQVTR